MANSQHRHVRFTRELQADEQYVVDQFVRHRHLCHRCSSAFDPREHQRYLCRYGAAYARDVTQYFHLKHGRILSVIDYNRKGVEVELSLRSYYQDIRALLDACAQQSIFCEPRKYHQQARSPGKEYGQSPDRHERNKRYTSMNAPLHRTERDDSRGYGQSPERHERNKRYTSTNAPLHRTERGDSRGYSHEEPVVVYAEIKPAIIRLELRRKDLVTENLGHRRAQRF
jgi:hypothetical protein